MSCYRAVHDCELTCLAPPPKEKNHLPTKLPSFPNIPEEHKVDSDRKKGSKLMQNQDIQSIPWAWVKAANEIFTNPPFEEVSAPVELLPWLYLPDWKCVVDNKENLKPKLGITHVLSMNEMSNEAISQLRDDLQRNGVKHHAIQGKDELDYDMIGNHWEECRNY